MTAQYRTPDEDAIGDVEDAYIRDVVGDAMADCASLLTAMQLGEPPPVVESWVDTLYDHLRGSLTPEQRVRAIVLLVQPDAEDVARRLLDAESPVRSLREGVAGP